MDGSVDAAADHEGHAAIVTAHLGRAFVRIAAAIIVASGKRREKRMHAFLGPRRLRLGGVVACRDRGHPDRA